MNWPELIRLYMDAWVRFAAHRMQTVGLHHFHGLEPREVVHDVLWRIFERDSARSAPLWTSYKDAFLGVREKIRSRVGYENRRRKLLRERYPELDPKDPETRANAHDAIVSDLGSRGGPDPGRWLYDFHGLLTLALEVGFAYCDGDKKEEIWATAQQWGEQKDIAAAAGVSDATVSRFNTRYADFHHGFVAELLDLEIDLAGIAEHRHGWFVRGLDAAKRWINDQEDDDAE